MILELATIDIKVGENVAFETALEQAKAVIAQASGFVKIEIQRCIEMENRYILLIQWQTLEDHTVGFRESPLFSQWRTLIGPYFEAAPFVQHFHSI
ncbi:MAG: antibiotic biosynthesis monooxygenase family protein [Flectobacillus sp.]|uniref:antibiotic biosynthesis monooxygenase family protein n=1 Tax=Flectobacillus sp. TaxID=50419 RepID=UPI003B9C0F23